MIPCVIESLDRLPLIAILRGLRPDEAVAVGEAIVAAGFICLEVPLNSPEPLESIARLRRALDGRALVGAGTVLDADAARAVARSGGQIIISPDTNPEVIRTAKGLGLLSIPGVFTPTEAFGALAAGADALKLFPAEVAGPAGLKAMRAVLPSDLRVYAVGGVDPQGIGRWRTAGASGFGVGSAIFKPGQPASLAGLNAATFRAAWTAASSPGAGGT